jgi:hypothetical protein
MIGQTILLLAAFFLGAIFTEIRWIGRMRQLGGLQSLAEAGKMYGDEGAQQSLRSLQQQLTDEAQASPVLETATRSKT